MYDYKLRTKFKDGHISEIGYQSMLLKLNMGSEMSHGAPLSEGGTPQVQTFIGMLKDIYSKRPNPIESITAYFNGEAVLSV